MTALGARDLPRLRQLLRRARLGGGDRGRGLLRLRAPRRPTGACPWNKLAGGLPSGSGAACAGDAGLQPRHQRRSTRAGGRDRHGRSQRAAARRHEATERDPAELKGATPTSRTPRKLLGGRVPERATAGPAGDQTRTRRVLGGAAGLPAVLG